MLIDKVVFTRLRPGKVADIVAELKAGRTAAELANPAGLPRDEVEYVETLVETNVRTRGPVFFRRPADYRSLVRDCLVLSPSRSSSRSRSRGYVAGEARGSSPG